MSELNELIGNGYIWTPAAKIRAAEADLTEARNVARKYYRLYQGAQEEILLFQESESYDAKRARDLIAELEEAQERIVELHSMNDWLRLLSNMLCKIKI